MAMLLLIDTRVPEPEPEHDWTWVSVVLSWLFPWPAITAWLFAGTVVTHGVAGMAFGVATIVVAAWRATKAYPQWGGLSDYRQ
jgi:hypothetical protein